MGKSLGQIASVLLLRTAFYGKIDCLCRNWFLIDPPSVPHFTSFPLIDWSVDGADWNNLMGFLFKGSRVGINQNPKEDISPKNGTPSRPILFISVENMSKTVVHRTKSLWIDYEVSLTKMNISFPCCWPRFEISSIPAPFSGEGWEGLEAVRQRQ